METKQEVDEKYLKEIHFNIVKAIITLTYFLFLNYMYVTLEIHPFERFIQFCTMILLFATIYIFERAYNKDYDKLALQGIELLVFSACTLTIQYITKKFGFSFQNYSATLGYIFSIYFVLRGIIIYTQGRKKIVDNYSDIKEILKKEEPIKKEATKKNKEKKKGGKPCN